MDSCSEDSSADLSDEFDCPNRNHRPGEICPRKKLDEIIARPNASAGFWLCCLLALAFSTHYLREPGEECKPVITYDMMTIAAIGMCIDSICFYIYMFYDTVLILKLIISFIPGVLTSIMYKMMLQQTWGFGIFWGFAITFCYQNVYIRVLRGLPRCFTVGEAALAVQGLILFLLNSIIQLPTILFAGTLVEGEFAELNTIMMSGIFCFIVACWLLVKFKQFRQPVAFYGLMVVLLIAVTCIPITKEFPVLVVWNFILKDTKHLTIVIFSLALLGLAVCVIFWQLCNTQTASTRLRKTFHLFVVLVYIPGLLLQCVFLYIASGVALALITLVELFRILNIPPLGGILKNAFISFADSKDAGLLAITPFSLLIGCSMPLWICPCPCSTGNAARNILPLMAGILSIGVGDTAASVVGSKYGRIKWRASSSRTLEGTVAFIVSVTMTVLCLNHLDYIPLTSSKFFYITFSTVCTALVEAQTDQIDNLVLPLIFYSLLSFA